MLKASLRSVLAHRGRLALSSLAVVLGVAFVAATLVFSDTINTAVTGLFDATAADVTITPQQPFTPEVEDQGLAGTIATLPAATVGQVAAVPVVAAAHGQVNVQNLTVVDRNNQRIGPTSGAPTYGQNWYDSTHPQLRLVAGRAPARAGEVLIDQTSAQRSHIGIGDPVHVITPSASLPETVVGLASFSSANPGIGLVVMDTATAQTTLLGGQNVFTGITVDAAPGVGDAVAAQRVQATLGPGFTVTTKAEQAASNAQQIQKFLEVVTLALLGFAGIAVLVGVFLIVNTFSMLVAQRTRELGLLRALGAGRGQVLQAVLVEALLVGTAGSLLGVAAGIGLAAAVKTLIGTAGVDLSGAPLILRWPTLAAAGVVGVVVTVTAAWLPARRGARVAPLQALREAAAPPRGRGILRAVAGLVLLAAGGGALVAAATGQYSLIVAGAVLAAGGAATLLACVLLGPVVARVVVSSLGIWLPLIFGVVGQLAQRNTVRNPRRTGATAAALMIGLSMVSAAAVVAASLNTSITREVDSSFGADFVVSAGGAQPVPAEVTAAVRAVPGVQAVTRQRYALAHYHGSQLALAGVDTATVDQALRPQYIAGSTADLARGGLMVDESTATTHGLRLGAPVEMTFLNGATATLPVAAISKTPAGGGKDGGTFEVSLDTLTRYVPTAGDVTVYVNTAPGVDTHAAGVALDHALAGYPQVQIQDQSDYKNQLTGQVTTILDLLYGLLALAVIIAVLGVVNTLTLSVIERTREIGLLRAVGLTRRQLRRLIRWEAVLIAIHGALLGVALGLAWGIAGDKVLVSYGITTVTIPWTTILPVLAGAVLVGLTAAILPAHRAARRNTLTAIATS